jgi:YggT family protein
VDFFIFVLSRLLFILQIALIGRALISWFDPRGANPISQFLITLTEPILAPIRSVMPRTGMFDFSIMVAIIVIIMLQQMLSQVAAA